MPDWTPVIGILLSGCLTLLCYGVKLLWDIREHLVKLNGRVTTCEELRQAHEDSDKDKHDGCEARLVFVERTLIGKQG